MTSLYIATVATTADVDCMLDMSSRDIDPELLATPSLYTSDAHDTLLASVLDDLRDEYAESIDHDNDPPPPDHLMIAAADVTDTIRHVYLENDYYAAIRVVHVIL